MTLPQPLRPATGPGASLRRDRRGYKRVDIRLTGRFLTADQDDCELITANVSCDGAFIVSDAPPEAGQKLICYFDDLGRIESDVLRSAPGGFAIRFQTSTLKRDKIADRLTWLLNKDKLGLVEERMATRFAATGQAVVILADGRQLQCRLTDISLTGAAFEALGTPPYVGDRVHTGNLPAEVMRVAGRSFAVRYLRGSEAKSG